MPPVLLSLDDERRLRGLSFMRFENEPDRLRPSLLVVLMVVVLVLALVRVCLMKGVYVGGSPTPIAVRKLFTCQLRPI